MSHTTHFEEFVKLCNLLVSWDVDYEYSERGQSWTNIFKLRYYKKPPMDLLKVYGLNVTVPLSGGDLRAKQKMQ